MAEVGLLAFGVALLEGAGLILLVPLLALVGVESPGGSTGVIADGVRAMFTTIGLQPTLPLVLLVYVVIVAVQSALHRRQSTVNALLQHAFVDTIRSRLYRAIVRARWAHLSKQRASMYTHLLTTEVDRIAGAVFYICDTGVLALSAAIYVALAFYVSGWITLFVLMGGGAVAFAVRSRIDEARIAGERYSEASATLYAAIGDQLGSLKAAKSHGLESRHAEAFDRLSGALRDVRTDTAAMHAHMRQWLTVGSSLVLAVIVYVAADVVGMPSASLLLLLFLYARLVPRFNDLYERSRALISELPAFVSVIDAEQRCVAEAEPWKVSHVGIAFSDRIEFQHVTFGYAADARPVVSDLNLTIRARATTAIVGPSGSGKSTVADLIMGLLEPTAGRMLVDDDPLRAETLKSWRSQIGYVQQETVLFHDTLRANLRWARPDASDAELWQSLTMASAHDFVSRMPSGLDTILGDRGILLSGGERQRLALARALLGSPKVLVLDEATSALDSENERRIQSALERLHEQITIVLITHRLSTVRGADLIYLLDTGVVAESGDWHTLMTRPGGRFRELCRVQGLEPGFSAPEPQA